MTTQLLTDLENVLVTGGLQAGLKFLNERVPHRCTAVYRLDQSQLRLVAAVDKADDLSSLNLSEIPLADSFCQYVMRDGGFVTTTSATDDRLDGHPYKGVMNSYVGLPLTKADGELFGTLCHFDFAEQTIDQAEYEFLQGVVTILPKFI